MPADFDFEVLVCRVCGVGWTRIVKRGPKPLTCIDCKYHSRRVVAPPKGAIEYTDGGRKEDGFTGENNDCTVRAMATATGRPYREAHDFLRKAGRKNKKGVTFRTALINAGNKALGFTFEYTHLARARGIKTAIQRNPVLKRGTWILQMPRHVATLKDGKLLDSFDSSRKEIRGAWLVQQTWS